VIGRRSRWHLAVLVKQSIERAIPQLELLKGYNGRKNKWLYSLGHSTLFIVAFDDLQIAAPKHPVYNSKQTTVRDITFWSAHF